MAQCSTIEWTESTWNPVVGCSKVSSGCANCYAERMARRLAGMAQRQRELGESPGRKAHYLRVVDNKGRWNGKVCIAEEALDDPLAWRNPRVVFVNSMSDLFHEQVPLGFVQRIIDVMKRCPQHTFQVLTKRPERAAEYSSVLRWPSNAWVGTSVENAFTLRRLKSLRRIRAEIRFVSLEPLLGPVSRLPLTGIHWVIVGGESGPGARPIEASWVRQIRDQCLSTGVPFFFKQWGGVNKKVTGRVLDGRTWDEYPVGMHMDGRKHGADQ